MSETIKCCGCQHRSHSFLRTSLPPQSEPYISSHLLWKVTKHCNMARCNSQPYMYQPNKQAICMYKVCRAARVPPYLVMHGTASTSSSIKSGFSALLLSSSMSFSMFSLRQCPQLAVCCFFQASAKCQDMHPSTGHATSSILLLKYTQIHYIHSASIPDCVFASTLTDLCYVSS